MSKRRGSFTESNETLLIELKPIGDNVRVQVMRSSDFICYEARCFVNGQYSIRFSHPLNGIKYVAWVS